VDPWGAAARKARCDEGSPPARIHAVTTDTGTFHVSVVIPWGKAEGDIERAVASALDQTLEPTEVIVVANGVIDARHALERLARYAGDRLSVVDGAGFANANAARNRGTARACTPWVAYLDSDDWWEPQWLASVEARFRELQGGADGFYGGIRVVDGDGAVIGTVHSHAIEEFRTPENYLLSYSSASACTYVLRRELLNRVPWDEALRRHQDYDLFVRLVASGARLVHVTEPMVNVDWSGATRHKAHRDCFAVVRPWAGRVQPGFYLRHLTNLTLGAVRNRDPAALFIPFGFLNPKIWAWYLRRPQP
jgi:glycosyltransferase involved in cell wall biosynthesis